MGSTGPAGTEVWAPTADGRQGSGGQLVNPCDVGHTEELSCFSSKGRI